VVFHNEYSFSSKFFGVGLSFSAFHENGISKIRVYKSIRLVASSSKNPPNEP
jgi:hypothetical protein